MVVPLGERLSDRGTELADFVAVWLGRAGHDWDGPCQDQERRSAAAAGSYSLVSIVLVIYSFMCAENTVEILGAFAVHSAKKRIVAARDRSSKKSAYHSRQVVAGNPGTVLEEEEVVVLVEAELSGALEDLVLALLEWAEPNLVRPVLADWT